MAKLPSDPDVLLKYLHDLPDKLDSDEDFNGYLDAEEGPVVYCSAAKFKEEEPSPVLWRSLSVHDLSESPLLGLSPSHSPMHASGSPLARDSPTHSHSTLAASSSTPASQVFCYIWCYKVIHIYIQKIILYTHIFSKFSLLC